MSLAKLYSRGQLGIEAPEVCVEVHLANGLPALAIVGLPEAAVKESKDRVRAALLSSGFQFPAKKITVNLAPADLPKEGGRFDLAIALGILAASGQLPREGLEAYEFLGELSLSGEIRRVPAVLPAAIQCRRRRRALIVPEANGQEAALLEDLPVHAADHLLKVCGHLRGEEPLPQVEGKSASSEIDYPFDFDEVKGHFQAKRALEIAAAGGHNVLMEGPPGSGKSMLAERLISILPPLNEEEALETAQIHSTAGLPFDPARWRLPPFRNPHHTASAVALVGGGSLPKPGEISLAHNGVLFLDELPEFPRPVLEVLREPLESGKIVISRAKQRVAFPARFQLIAAMNPCPCGYLGDPSGRCRCTPSKIQRYRSRISGPLLDRIDLHLEVVPQTEAMLSSKLPTLSSAEMRARVVEARDRMFRRQGKINSHLKPKEIERFCVLDHQGEALLIQAVQRLHLSHRALHRILKLARTIADLEGRERIELHHLSEAIGYRTRLA